MLMRRSFVSRLCWIAFPIAGPMIPAWREGGAVSIGHRRLSIIDLSPLGHQPMVSRSGRFVITFNGEIYNYQRLRRELQVRGCEFKGQSDTEVLLALIEERGLEVALPQCTGMFAFALWDRHERKMQLARDRFGEKPLCYGWHRGVFLFGSELKAVAAHHAYARAVNRDALAELLRLWAYVPSPHTIYQRTAKLRPGTILTQCKCRTIKSVH